MRGKPRIEILSPLCCRNIPAYAGKTLDITRQKWYVTEHPRVCGENDFQTLEPDLYHGTSPRMRGKRKLTDCVASIGRNIPAYAGKTLLPICCYPSEMEHPRVCGENPRGRGGSPCGWGTSPRMRGKLPKWPPNPSRRRNIPAYAGKTAVTRGLP